MSMSAAFDGERLMTFGQCLRHILKEKNLSASALSRMMENKSRNSLFRILDDTSSPAAQEAFCEKLIRGNWLDLSTEQCQMLQRSLEISRVGIAGYRSNQAMRSMLSNVSTTRCDHSIMLDVVSRGERIAFDQQLAIYANARSVSVTITGCCERNLLFTLADGLLRGQNSEKVRITHYLCTGGDEIIRGVSAIQPLLYSCSYDVFCITPGTFSPEREQIYRSNSIVILWEDQQGILHRHLISMVDRDILMLIDNGCHQGMELIARLMQADQKYMYPLKSTFVLSHSPQDYLAYTAAFDDLERNRAIYTIKPDMCIMFISPEILRRPVTEGFLQTGFASTEEFSPLIDAFADIHRRRFDNLYTKKKPTHAIFSAEAMERFARTGVQSDHFFAIHPYSPQERMLMLRHIRSHAAENPFFNIYFFKESFDPPKSEIGLYEGIGTLMLQPYTHYDLAAGHAEVLITQREFCQKYKEFFVRDLLERQVLPKEKTLGLLDHLIDIAQSDT